MGNEMWQARLDDEFAAEVHEYREDRHMSKSEVVRHGLREVVQDEDEDEADEAEDEADEGPETRTIRTGQHLSSLAQLIQLVLTLAVFVIVAGGGV
jgi:Arc/MetJ-type ribon-helix-helix transcriptional regulator